MPPLGAHKSIAGGFEKAVARALLSGCECLQIFTKNASQWRAPPLDTEGVEAFRAAIRRAKIDHAIAHDSYLINLASPEEPLWQQSIEAMVDELGRAEALGLQGLVAHPGAFTRGTEEGGIARIVAAIDAVHARLPRAKVRILLETTAGQGSCLGSRFEQIAEIIARSKRPRRLGVCLDTCHIFAAGYRLDTLRHYERTMAELEATVGLDRVAAVHLNDSRGACGSHLDRHAHIGEGQIGLAGFRRLLNDERFARVPMYLETPKEDAAGNDLDLGNLALLRSLQRR